MSVNYYEDEECFYCHIRGQGLQEHHLFKGNERKHSPTVYLCYRCHNRAHKSNWFYHHLQALWTDELKSRK